MNNSVAARLHEDKVFWTLLIAAAIFSFFELIPNGVRSEAIGPFLGLTFGAIILTMAGWAVSVLCDLRFATANCALQIGIAQVVLLVWVYLRSVLSAVFERLAGSAIPVSQFELLLLIGALVWLAHRKRSIRTFARIMPGFLWVVVAIFLISQRELPREIMLSSDPDQHLFFTAQILKFGVVPFHLAEWGPSDFQYPAGFAALSALWSWLGAVTVPNAVTIQPLLQTLLSLLAIASIAARVMANKELRLEIASGYFVLVLFFGFFPFTLTSAHFGLEKTGSISSMLLLVTTLVLAAEGGFGPRPRPRVPALLLSGAGVGLSALINPVAVIVPGVVYGASLLKVLWEIRPSAASVCRSILLCVAPPLMVILADPYYAYRFVLQRTLEVPPVPAGIVVPQGSFVSDALARATELFITFDWTRPFLLLPYFGRYVISVFIIATTISALLLLLPRERRYPALRLMALGPLLVIVLEFALLPVFFGIRSKGDFYLLEPYFAEALARFAYLWYLSILVLALAQLFKRLTPFPYGAALCVLLVTVVMIPVRSARDRLPNEVKMQPRFDRCSSLGCVYEDDRIVLSALRDKFDEYVSRGGSSDFRAIPKVLLPNAPLVFGRESWIMPTGASRGLPMVPTFPAAFFYYKGSPDYSYQSYLDHVCLKLDIPWLKERNIRYLFVPTDRKKVCLAGLEALLREGNVLVRSGNSALIELF